jgi:hypothetical protein
MASTSRAAGRGSWPVRLYRLGAEPGDDLSAITSAEERLAMMWPMTLEAWGLSGLPVPDYPRSQTPVSLRPAREAGRAGPAR